MNKLYTFFIIISTCATLPGQTYESVFGTESTQWNITIGNLWGIGFTEHRVVGDTTIGNLTYATINGYSEHDVAFGMLREDSLHQKAWYRNWFAEEEILVMDLSLEVGDSLFVQGSWNGDLGYHKVDSVYIFDDRKHIQIDLPVQSLNNKKLTLVEGIVSNLGFRYQDNEYENGVYTKLLCAFKNEQKVYGDGECSIPFTSTSESEPILPITAYPNPVTSELFIDLAEPILKGEIQLIDQLGRTIYRSVGQFSTAKIIDMSTLHEGIYILLVRDYENHTLQSSTILKVKR